MGKMRIFWTDFALSELKEIYKYYEKKASIDIAARIHDTILLRVFQLEQNPLSGQIEPNLLDLRQKHRYLVEGNFKIIYRIYNSSIFITDVFDTRQDPKKMMKPRRRKPSS